MKKHFTPRIRLYDDDGHRRYLQPYERELFLSYLATETDTRKRLLMQVLVYSGIRPIEATHLSRHHVDESQGRLMVRSAKKRNDCDPRGIPLPWWMIDDLLALKTSPNTGHRFWPYCRSTIWRHAKTLLRRADIVGPHANARALRHSFAIHAVISKVALNKIARWMGHENIATTAIYADAVCEEERLLAEYMWSPSDKAPRRSSLIILPNQASQGRRSESMDGCRTLQAS